MKTANYKTVRDGTIDEDFYEYSVPYRLDSGEAGSFTVFARTEKELSNILFQGFENVAKGEVSRIVEVSHG